MSSRKPAIGIDLGTTRSCVAVWLDGKVRVIPNEQGHQTTPSCVAFTDTERLVGDVAKDQMVMNPKNTIFDVKRLIGRRFLDPDIQEDMKHWPFKVVDYIGNPKIQVEYKGDIKNFAPEEIISMILSYMKAMAEAYLGESVQDAVITVPAYFNDSQRQATKDAGVIAGLNVMRIIIEPTAAALAYGLEKNLKQKKNVLVYDLGGGTFDVSVLTVDTGSVFEVKATSGNTHLGGEDFDNRLVDHFADDFKKKYKKDVRLNSKAMSRLRNAAEKAKRTLSSTNEANIDLDCLYLGIDFHTKILRSRFDELCSDLFLNTLKPVQQAIEDAKIDKSSIDDVVLVGGSTRIRKIQSLLEKFFCGKMPNISINPDEAVAYGAAVQAAILSGNAGSQIKDVVLLDVTPLSLGIECNGGVMSRIIKCNERIPCKRTKNFTTVHDNQSVIQINVFEGERELTKCNNLLGTFSLGGIPPVPRGVPSVNVTFELDMNGILTVTAVDKSTGNARNIAVDYEKSRLTPDQIQRMLEDAERYREDDKKEKDRVKSRIKLEEYIYGAKRAVDEAEARLRESEKQLVRAECRSVMQWLERNSLAEKEEYEDMLEDTELQCKPIMMKLHRREPWDIIRETAEWLDRVPFSWNETNDRLEVTELSSDLDRVVRVDSHQRGRGRSRGRWNKKNPQQRRGRGGKE